MANLQKTLLSAIKTAIEQSSLTYIKKVYIIQALQESYIPDIGNNAVYALIYPQNDTFTPASLPDVCQDAVYRIGVSVIQEWWGPNIGMVGDGVRKGAAEIEADIQTLLDRNLLNVATVALFTGANYAPMGGRLQGLAQVHCQLEYHDFLMG